eukprot:1161430-Alexandrium_andersonii.AAC.1
MATTLCYLCVCVRDFRRPLAASIRLGNDWESVVFSNGFEPLRPVTECGLQMASGRLSQLGAVLGCLGCSLRASGFVWP